MRRVLAGAGLVLAAAFLTGCGDDASDAPDDASTEEFCDAFESAPSGDGTPSEDEIDEWVDALGEAGTPDDIDDEQRDGFEIFIETVDDADPEEIDADAQIEDVIQDADDREKVLAFITYYAEKCSDVPEVPEQ